MRNWDPNFPLFTGIFTDFDPTWYNSVGITILFTMIVFSCSAQVSFVLLKILSVLARCIDSGCRCNGKTTKQLTKNKYMKTYVGPFFDIGTRYSEVIYVN